MKTIIMTAALLVQIPALAKNISELEVKCTMTAKVAEVSGISYSPGAPAHHRVPEIPSSLHFKTKLEVITQSEGCQVLQSKYKIFPGHLNANAGISPAVEAQATEALALKNQVVELVLQQQFGFQTSGGHLPLFPTVHSESLSLGFSAGAISGSVQLPFDVNHVYGIGKVENMTDIEKLALAEKTHWLALKYDFHGLFLELEPKQNHLKKAYAQLIWKIFKQPKANDYLQFHVGGNGSFTGKPLAVKLNTISHIPGIFSSKEIVQLLTDFPTWMLAGFSGKECLNFTATELEAVLENAQVSFPVMAPGEARLWQSPLQHIAGPFKYVTQCVDGKVSDYAKVLAAELLKK